MALAITIVITFCVVVTLVNNHTHIRGLEEDIEYLQRFLLKKGAKEKELLSALKANISMTRKEVGENSHNIAYLQMEVGHGDGVEPLFYRVIGIERHLGLGTGETVHDLLEARREHCKQCSLLDDGKD